MRRSEMFPSVEFMTKWHRLLQDTELAKNYDRVYALDDALVGRNPFLDDLLASFLFLRLLSLLDDALEEVAAADSAIVFPKKKPAAKQDLFDKIDAMAAAGRVTPDQATDLHGMRKWRNDIAHEPQPHYLEWQLLSKAFGICEAVLRRLGLSGPKPLYEFFAERSAAEASDDPRVFVAFRYQAGVKENGIPELTLHWTSKILKEDTH
jgi:hypothetical protein